jgi:putative ABC transport system substrate-binding protein
MRRRDFIKLIGSSTAAWPLQVLAQQGERARQIAILMGLDENDVETKARLAKLRSEMEKLGWVEGRNLHIEVRFAPAALMRPNLPKS